MSSRPRWFSQTWMFVAYLVTAGFFGTWFGSAADPSSPCCSCLLGMENKPCSVKMAWFSSGASSGLGGLFDAGMATQNRS